MLTMCNGSLVAAAKATARRRIVPLPLFWLPSISNKFASPQARHWRVRVEIEVANN